jgi:hypothetical protein
MAFATTNKAFQSPGDAVHIPIAHTELADKTAAVAAEDLDVAGLKWLRGRIRVKAFGADNTQFSFKVIVSSTSAMTTPEVLFTSPTHVATSSNDTGVNIDFTGWSNAGFRYVTITPTTATGAITYDVILDAA